MDAPASPAPGRFVEVVTSTSWRQDVDAWVHDRVVEAGLRLSGPLEQIRVRPWSTQLVVPTDRGRLWFKAGCPSMRFEAGLVDLLSRLVPGAVAAPLAVDPDRGWLLTPDRGSTLGDLRASTLQDWCTVVTTAARLQRDLADHTPEVLAAGVPDCSPATVPDRFEQVLEHLASLPVDHPSHLEEPLRRRFEAVAPQVAEAAAMLVESPIPATLQHGDLHPNNLFADLSLFDFGDAQWAHAVEVLQVPYAWITRQSDLPWAPVRDAYLAVWDDLVDHRTLRTLAEASVFTHAVNRSVTWLDAMESATEDDVAQWGEGALATLSRVIDA